MLVSQKYGGLPLLSSIFDYGPAYAVAIMLVADFGIICALMWAEGIPPWERAHYKTFVWNDTLFIPLYCGVVTFVIGKSPAMSGFYTKWWWHWTLLVAGFVASIFIEIGAVKNGQYTMSQELSPSKLWHTFIFGIVAYWLSSTIIPVLASAVKNGQIIPFTLVIVAIAGFIYNSYRDSVLPWPKDAHLEGSWIGWSWDRRIYPPWLQDKIR